jgi:hypothetical protein
MADSQFKSMLSDIVSAVSTNKNVLDEVKSDNAMVIELLNTIYQRVEDMSKKFDEVLNTGIKKPNYVAPKKATTKVIKAKTTSTISTTSETPLKKSVVKVKASDAKSADTDEPVKVIKNIMTFFKTRYIEDASIFDDIMEENQAEAVFAENESDIAAKKEGVQRDKTKATILYKNLTKAQKKKVREKMMDEHDAAIANNDEDVDEENDSD